MNVISEQLSGLHSFTGVGVLVIDGQELAICGSKQVYLGNGKRVKYLQEQIRRVEPEKERVVVISGLFAGATSTQGEPVYLDVNLKPVLYFGWLDGVPLGAEIGYTAPTEAAVHPGFVIIGKDATTLQGVETSALDTAVIIGIDNVGPYYGLTLRKE